MVRRAATILSLSLLCTCGSEGARLQIELVLPNDHDPFQDVATIRITITGDSMDTIVAEGPYRSGSRLMTGGVQLGSQRVIMVEGLDANGVPVSQGKSDAFDLSEDSPSSVQVPFTRCAKQVYRDSDKDGFGDPAHAGFLLDHSHPWTFHIRV